MKSIPKERLPYSPSQESLQIIEQSGTALFPDRDDLSAWHVNYIAGHKKRIAIDLDIVKKWVPKGSSIVEFGAVPLLLTRSLAVSNYKVTGVDIAPERYTETINKIGAKIVKCNIEIEKLPFNDHTFDAVLFNELFEHLRINPIFTMTEVLRVLKPGGVLLLSTPNLRSVVGIKNFLFNNKSYSCSARIYNEYQKLETLGHMGHVREYTTTEVAVFLKQIGFKVEKLLYRGRYFGYKKGINKLFPQLSPFVSYVARKPVR